MKHEERLRLMFDKYKMLGYVAKNIKKWEHFAFYIACLLNFIVLFSYSEYYVTSEQKLSKVTYNRGRLYDPRLFYMKDQTDTEAYIMILGIINIVFYSIVVAVFLMKKAPILIGNLWEKYYKLYRSDWKKKNKKKLEKKDEGAMPLQLVGALTTHAFGIFNKLLLFVVNALKSVMIMMQDYEIIYYVFNMMICVFGLTVHPFIFVGCLTDLLRSK